MGFAVLLIPVFGLYPGQWPSQMGVSAWSWASVVGLSYLGMAFMVIRSGSKEAAFGFVSLLALSVIVFFVRFNIDAFNHIGD